MNAPISVERGWFRFGTWGQARQARTRSTVLRSASFRKNAFVRTFVGHFLGMAEVSQKIGHLAERVGFEPMACFDNSAIGLALLDRRHSSPSSAEVLQQQLDESVSFLASKEVG